MTRRSVGQRFLVAACLAGGTHAAFSLYWAVGGGWLFDTVGRGAVDLQAERPLAAAAVLVAAAAVKGAVAVLPLLVERGRLARLRRLARLGSWLAGAVLVVYGTVIALVSAAVLSGAIAVDGDIDRRGMLGHALIWDPLFAVWGVCLTIGLWCTRQRGRLGDAVQVDSYAAG